MKGLESNRQSNQGSTGDPRMIMQHDQSVQKVGRDQLSIPIFASKFNKRNQSVTSTTLARKLSPYKVNQ